MAELTTREVVDRLWERGIDIDLLKLQRLIKEGKVEAEKRGWFWFIPEEEVDRLEKELRGD